MNRRIQDKLITAGVFAVAIIVVAAVIGEIYAAGHFLMKFW